MVDITTEKMVHSICESLKLNEDRAARFMDAFVESVDDALQAGKEVKIEGVGLFQLVDDQGKPLPGMYNADIGADVAALMKDSSDSAVRSILAGLSEVMRQALMGGDKLVLGKLGSFEIREEPPQIEVHPKGHRLIRPAMTAFIFDSDREYKTTAGEGKLAFQPVGDFKKKVEQFRSSSIMLIVPENDFFVKTLEYYFDNAGWDIDVYESVEAARADIEKNQAFLIVVDSSVDGYQELVRDLKLKKESNAVPVILLFQSEDSLKVLPEIVVMGDENIAQPFEFRRLLDAADGSIMRVAEETLIFDQQVEVHLPTEEKYIEQIIEDFQKLFENSGMNDEAQVAVAAAFREAVVNAAQHGNKYKKKKKIEIEYLLDPEKVTIVVSDQGEGFDHEQYVRRGQGGAVAAARDRHSQGRMGGLGILLMLRCCDQLEYSQQGNRITLTKRLDSGGQRQVPIES